MIERAFERAFVPLLDPTYRTPRRCQRCGVLFIEGPTSRDRERYARRECGGCDDGEPR